MNSIYELFLYFFIYSVIGWIVEMIYCAILDGKFTERGFLYGPYCPIYGFGGIIVSIFLNPFKDKIWLVFLLAMLLTTVLEYITSFLMEKIFDAKWWDYSTYFLNINGRVCLRNTILFGILGLVITYLIHPYVYKLIYLIPGIYVPYIAFSLAIILFIDFVITLNSFFNFKGKLKELQELVEKDKEKNKNYNNEIIQKIEELHKHLAEMKSSFSSRRLIKAFPNLKFSKLNNAFEDIKTNLTTQLENKKKKTTKNS